MTAHRPLRRVVGLLVSLVMLHTFMWGSGIASALTADGGSLERPDCAGMAPAGMPDRMSVTPAETSASAMSLDARDPAPARVPGHPLCGLPWAPAGCHNAGPCLPAVLPSMAQSPSANRPAPERAA